MVNPRIDDRFPSRRFDPCVDMQADISALLDSELDQERAGRVLVHIEMCAQCNAFWRSLREQIEVHRELWGEAVGAPPCDDPWAGDLFADADVAQLVESTEDGSFLAQLVAGGSARLADVFYQLGRAYLLLTTTKDFVRVVCRAGVPIPEYRLRGRAILDGVGGARVEPQEAVLRDARVLLEERLDAVANNVEKGRCLLQEALRLRPGFPAAKIWLGQSHMMAGNDLPAARALFQEVVADRAGAKDPVTKVPLRVYALEALGNVCLQQDQPAEAMRYFQLVIDSGAPRLHANFWTAYLNFGYAAMRSGRATEAPPAFERAYEDFPARRDQTARILALRPDLARLVAADAEAEQRLARSCPDWFGPGASTDPGPTVSFQIISDGDSDVGRAAPLDPALGEGV